MNGRRDEVQSSPDDVGSPLRARAWLPWLAAGAVAPGLQAVGWTALNKQVLATDAWASWLPTMLLLLAACSLLGSLSVYAWALRRLAPRLHFPSMLAALIAAVVIGGILSALGMDLRPARAGSVRAIFELRQHVDGPAFAHLPWLSLLWRSALWTAAVSACPAILFARALRLPWRLPLLACTVAGVLVACIEPAWGAFGGPFESLDRLALNGWRWPERMGAVLAQAARGVVWTAASLLAFVGLLQMFEAGRARALSLRPRAILVVSSLAILVSIAACIGQPGGASAAWVAVQRALSAAPAQDIAVGEPLLQLAARGPESLQRLPWRAELSPDGRWVVAVSGSRSLLVFDTASGGVVQRLADRLGGFEYPGWAWSTDGRWLAVRTDGDRWPGRYEHHQARVRLYAVPGFQLSADYRHGGSPCLSETVTEPPMLFDSSAHALWIACGQEVYPHPRDLAAIRLGVDKLQLLEAQPYGEPARVPLQGMGRVGTSVWAWQVDARHPPYVTLRDLDRKTEAVRLQAGEPLAPSRDWLLQEVRLDDTGVRLRLADRQHAREARLAYDTHTGALLAREEFTARPLDEMAAQVLQTPAALRIESRWTRESRAGELRVLDAATGRQRQVVRTVAQILLSVSADGRWLATQAVGDGELRIYRIGRPAATP